MRGGPTRYAGGMAYIRFWYHEINLFYLHDKLETTYYRPVLL